MRKTIWRALVSAGLAAAVFVVSGSAEEAVEGGAKRGRLGAYNLEELNRSGIPPLLEGIETAEDWERKREAIRAVWLETMGGLPERVPVEFTMGEDEDGGGHVRRHLRYKTVYGDEVTAWLLIPKAVLAEKGKRWPAVLALHPTNEDGKDSVALKEGRKNRTYGYELAERGYVVLAPDAMTSGERIFEGLKSFRDAPFYEKHPEWSTVGKNLADHMQAVDLLVSLDFVDPDRIGVIGHSFGGYNAYFLSSMDERIAVAVSSCGLSPFTGKNARPGHWGVRNWYTHFPKLTPHLERGTVPFEFNEIIALTAPRPFFNYSTQSDHIFPHWEPVGQCMADLYGLYNWMKATERFQSIIGSGGHDFPPEIRELAYQFLDRWLTEAGAE